MENISDALKMAGAALLFVIALTVTIRYNNSTDNAYQRFTLTYSIMVYKSVEASVTYPSPAGEALKSEYIEDGSKFESAIENFFAHSPIFGSGARVAYNSASVSGNEIVYTTGGLQNFFDYHNGSLANTVIF